MPSVYKRNFFESFEKKKKILNTDYKVKTPYLCFLIDLSTHAELQFGKLYYVSTTFNTNPVQIMDVIKSNLNNQYFNKFDIFLSKRIC